jgi:hypothetical protein
VRRRLVPALTVLALALAGAAAAARSEAAVPPGDAQLLRRYAPLLVLHPSERFRPERVDGFLADASLVSGHYDQRLCRAIDGPVALDCYASADAAYPSAPTVYGAVFRDARRTILEYWLFYYLDLYSATDPPGDFWQVHEGDWEAVVVQLDAAGKPVALGTSRHCSGARRAWARVERRATRPVVYVALGSHANYFRRGEAPLDRRCWPDVANRIYDAYGVVLRDHVAAGPVLRPQVVPVTRSSPSWMRFPGAWGETQYVHFPNNQPFAFGLGPVGPAFHALWRRPAATLLSWPSG